MEKLRTSQSQRKTRKGSTWWHLANIVYVKLMAQWLLSLQQPCPNANFWFVQNHAGMQTLADSRTSGRCVQTQSLFRLKLIGWQSIICSLRILQVNDMARTRVVSADRRNAGSGDDIVLQQFKKWKFHCWSQCYYVGRMYLHQVLLPKWVRNRIVFHRCSYSTSEYRNSPHPNCIVQATNSSWWCSKKGNDPPLQLVFWDGEQSSPCYLRLSQTYS